MNFNYIHKVSICLLIGLLALANANGPGTVQGKDRTGSPIGEGSCATCHNTGNFAPTVEIKLIQNNDEVNSYIPGEDYLLRIEANATQGTPDGYGFQAVALDGGNQTAGTWGGGFGYKEVTVEGVEYVEHEAPSPSDFFLVNWKAPETDIGNVSFYAASSVVNGNNMSSGDNGVVATPLVVEAGSGVSVKNEILPIDIKVYPTPASDNVYIESIELKDGYYYAEIIDVNGKLVDKFEYNVVGNSHRLEVELRSYANGQYFVRITGDDSFGIARIIKI